MLSDRADKIRGLCSLVPVASHTELIEAIKDRSGYQRIKITDKLPAPVDEFGIPRAEIMLDRIMGAMTTRFVWTGKIDLHHLATPKADYSAADTGSIGSLFRGLSQLKIDLPRQKHDFVHAVFDYHKPPALDVMMQAISEVEQGKALQSIFGAHERTYEDFWQDDKLMWMCRIDLLIALESMNEPQVNMMPPLNDLANLPLKEMRQAVNSIVNIRRIGDKKIVHPAVRKQNSHMRHAA